MRFRFENVGTSLEIYCHLFCISSVNVWEQSSSRDDNYYFTLICSDVVFFSLSCVDFSFEKR